MLSTHSASSVVFSWDERIEMRQLSSSGGHSSSSQVRAVMEGTHSPMLRSQYMKSLHSMSSQVAAGGGRQIGPESESSQAVLNGSAWQIGSSSSQLDAGTQLGPDTVCSQSRKSELHANSSLGLHGCGGCIGVDGGSVVSGGGVG